MGGLGHGDWVAGTGVQEEEVAGAEAVAAGLVLMVQWYGLIPALEGLDQEY